MDFRTKKVMDGTGGFYVLIYDAGKITEPVMCLPGYEVRRLHEELETILKPDAPPRSESAKAGQGSEGER